MQDGLVLSHWRRVADEGQTYPYSRFNKLVDVPTYSKEEYEVRREREEGKGRLVKVLHYFSVTTVCLFSLYPPQKLLVSFFFFFFV